MTTSETPPLNLYKLAWPVFISQISGGLVAFADTVFLSIISEPAAAAAGVITPYLWLAFFIIPVMASAGVSVAAQYTGAKQFERVIPCYIANILIVTSFGIIFSLFTLCFYDRIGLWFNLPSEVNIFASDYLQVMSGAYTLMAINASYTAILSVRAKTHWNMIVVLIGNGINILLNMIFVYGWFGISPQGVSGIATASLIALAISSLIYFWIVHVRENIKFDWSQSTRHQMKQVMRPLLKISIPTTLEPANYVMQQMVLMSMVASLGVISMAAHTFVFRLLFVEIAVGWALASAGQIILAHYAGARNHPAAQEIFFKCIKIAMLFSFFNIFLYLIFYKTFIQLFTHDPDVIALSRTLFIICIFMEPFRQINIIGSTALKAVGDAKFSAIVGILFIWGALPVAYLIGVHWAYGLVGLWICFAIDEIARGVVNICRWYSGAWKYKSIIEESNVT